MYGTLEKIENDGLYLLVKQKKKKNYFVLCQAGDYTDKVSIGDRITFKTIEKHEDSATNEIWVIKWEIYKINDEEISIEN